MEPMIWNESLTVGLPEVDADHHKLVVILNTLIEHYTHARPLDQVARVLNELVSYTSWHFRHEERLMQTNRYPGFAAHRKEHNDLIQQARTVQEQFQQQGGEVVPQAVDFIKSWLVNHILATDKAMANYLHPILNG